MALDSRIMKMVADANGKNSSPGTSKMMASVLDDLAELGLAKATKADLQRIVVLAANRDREAEVRQVLEELDRLV